MSPICLLVVDRFNRVHKPLNGRSACLSITTYHLLLHIVPCSWLSHNKSKLLIVKRGRDSWAEALVRINVGSFKDKEVISLVSHWGWCCISVGDCLHSMCEALGSIPSSTEERMMIILYRKGTLSYLLSPLFYPECQSRFRGKASVYFNPGHRCLDEEHSFLAWWRILSLWASIYSQRKK